MHTRQFITLAAFSLTSFSTCANGMDISFFESPPAFPPGSHLKVEGGVTPGTPVVFERSSGDTFTLRPAKKGQIATSEHPVYVFEWQADRAARFYRLTPPADFEKLKAANARDTATKSGKDYELKVVGQFLQDGKALGSCLKAAKNPPKEIQLMFVVGANSKLGQAVVQPEGALAECIIEQARQTSFSPPPGSRAFTAGSSIGIHD